LSFEILLGDSFFVQRYGIIRSSFHTFPPLGLLETFLGRESCKLLIRGGGRGVACPVVVLRCKSNEPRKVCDVSTPNSAVHA
jgi:hypothetical protein